MLETMFDWLILPAVNLQFIIISYLYWTIIKTATEFIKCKNP